MGDTNVPRLTATQLLDISKRVATHRPAYLVESDVAANKVCLRGISRTGLTYGMWRLELDGGDMLLRVVIGETMYTERLPASFPYRFNRILNGVELWAKAMNAEELKDYVAYNPHLGHLRPESIMNPAEYSPLGGVPTW